MVKLKIETNPFELAAGQSLGESGAEASRIKLKEIKDKSLKTPDFVKDAGFGSKDFLSDPITKDAPAPRHLKGKGKSLDVSQFYDLLNSDEEVNLPLGAAIRAKQSELEHKAKSIASQNLGTINADPDLINMTINEIKTGNPLSDTQYEYLKNNLTKIGEDPGLIEKMSSSEKISLYSSYRDVDKILDKYSESFDD